jgi:hypothetical protein
MRMTAGLIADDEPSPIAAQYGTTGHSARPECEDDSRAAVRCSRVLDGPSKEHHTDSIEADVSANRLMSPSGAPPGLTSERLSLPTLRVRETSDESPRAAVRTNTADGVAGDMLNATRVFDGTRVLPDTTAR